MTACKMCLRHIGYVAVISSQIVFMYLFVSSRAAARSPCLSHWVASGSGRMMRHTSAGVSSFPNLSKVAGTTLTVSRIGRNFHP